MIPSFTPEEQSQIHTHLMGLLGTMSLVLPAYFFDDHDERELPTPRVLHRTARTVTVAANDPNLAELLNDAEHYADPDMNWASEYRGLVASARATVRVITTRQNLLRNKQQPPARAKEKS